MTEVSGWDYMAQLSYGQNGDMWGPREITVCGPNYETTGEYMMWDENPDDGVDSGWRQTGLSFDSTSLKWGLEGIGVTQDVVETDGIDYIDIRTVTKNQAAMLWKNAMVLFYKDGILTEQVDLGSFGSDTMDQPALDEQILRITPENSDNDKVLISGMVKLMAPEGAYPAEDEIFSQIMIYA